MSNRQAIDLALAQVRDVLQATGADITPFRRLEREVNAAEELRDQLESLEYSFRSMGEVFEKLRDAIRPFALAGRNSMGMVPEWTRVATEYASSQVSWHNYLMASEALNLAGDIVFPNIKTASGSGQAACLICGGTNIVEKDDSDEATGYYDRERPWCKDCNQYAD